MIRMADFFRVRTNGNGFRYLDLCLFESEIRRVDSDQNGHELGTGPARCGNLINIKIL